MTRASLQPVAVLAAFLAITLAAGSVGAKYPPGTWYAQLEKPPFTPPNWLFAPVWTLLYILMAVAAWLVWRRAGLREGALPLALYAFHLGINIWWSWLFFGMHLIGGAFADLVLLWVCIVLLSVLFWRIRVAAGMLMLPYIAWVSLAGVLNFALWRLNP
jgi:tryptophan-rich sensory protein